MPCTGTDSDSVLALIGDATKAAWICASYDVTTLGVPAAVTRYLIDQVDRNSLDIRETKAGLDISALLTAGYQVFVMQAGFALYAAGVIRAKNIVNILTKNFIDACVGAVMFYLVGWAFAFGEGRLTNGFVGFWDFGLVKEMRTDTENVPYHIFLWNWAFCSASATVLSGAVAERATFISYLMYSVFISGWVYPVIAHWFWATSGWLNPNYISGPLFKAGCIDFAGSGVVHTVAGVASFFGAWLVGPRYGRFEKGADPDMFKGYSPANYVLGTFLLWYGWYGFNPGSLQRFSNRIDATVVARTAVNTTLAASFGAMAILFLTFWLTRKWNLLATCSGALSGLVAVTANCSVTEPWAAVLVGGVAAVIYTYGEMLEIYLKIDDPVSAFPMHALCGIWGVFFNGLLAKKEYIEEVYLREVYAKRFGAFYGGDGWLLAAQCVGIAAICGWVGAHMFTFFYLLRRAGLLRVRIEEEVVGLDVASHGTVPNMDVVNPYADRVFANGPMGYKKQAMGGGMGGGGGGGGYASPMNGNMNINNMTGGGYSQPTVNGGMTANGGSGALGPPPRSYGGNPNDSKTGGGWGSLENSWDHGPQGPPPQPGGMFSGGGGGWDQVPAYQGRGSQQGSVQGDWGGRDERDRQDRERIAGMWNDRR